MKIKFLLLPVLIAAIFYSALSLASDESFSPADNLPRGALVYAETADLPALLSLWNNTKLKTDYLGSQNFRDLKNSHLGLKLASRWQEFNEAAGFEFDLAAIAGFADKRAAVAVYDIGKLDIVFIAPMSGEIFATTRLTMPSAKFESEEYENGPVIYRADVAADRGRQKQELIYTHIKGHLVIATNEALLVRTVANLNHNSRKNRLSDDPKFSKLAERCRPGLATVWLDQAALNDNYYFKRYWMFSDRMNLTSIRSGIFTITLDEKKLVEHREFLLDKNSSPAISSATETSEILSRIPSDVEYFRLINRQEKAADAVKTVVFGRSNNIQNERPRRIQLDSSDFYIGYHDSSPDSFSVQIDETVDENESGSEPPINVGQSDMFGNSGPESVVEFGRAEALDDPLFVKFQRGVVIRLNSRRDLDTVRFESVLAGAVSKMITAGDVSKVFQWETSNECGKPVRQLRLPLLGRNFAYKMNGNYLFVANDINLLCETNETRRPVGEFQIARNTTGFAFIDIGKTRSSFGEIFSLLAPDEARDDLFTGSIAGLIDSTAIVRIELQSGSEKNFLFEEISFEFRRSGQMEPER